MVVSSMVILYNEAVSYSTGKLEHGRNPSLDVILLRTNLLMGTLILVVRFFVEVIVFFSAKVYESTMGEYLGTQQALTIGRK